MGHVVMEQHGDPQRFDGSRIVEALKVKSNNT
jgi:hypothetical protein